MREPAASLVVSDRASDTAGMSELLPPVGRFQVIEWIDETGSTNADLVARARQGATGPLVLIAEMQTSGRGRRDRRWDMPAGGGVLMSVLVPRPEGVAAIRITMALAVAVVEVLRARGADVAVKWPNDIVASDDRKLGGMLAEITPIAADHPGGAREAVVAGLGLNVSWPPPGFEDLPDAVALAGLIGPDIDRRALVVDLLTALDGELTGADGRAVFDRYRDRLATLGRTVRIETDRETLVGQVVDITPDGALIVDHGGVRSTYTVADVRHLRPGLGSSH